ncbi:RagB/SusD family nutrient uptake outer membrane protein [Pinibacter aurantiacus]|uniref:RagB/SusD family nutrient uptake outer membrane protein n=1 Tax=Pinibacter aurantiacus TaxID=2851599 RepID=A0A9E2SC69_9BACT|nr:RagB/SusD family nutrient uptake outer membrane protein [Pinibacter aurantiacus]MBV4360398.1 RagB/SusD family nutrient uptake outer membrane protein [Pinibacter aurantiacus]
MKTIQYKIFSLIGITTVLSLGACKKVDDFLSVAPSKTTSLVVTTTDQLNALLNNYATIFSAETNSTAIYSTDDFGLTSTLYSAGSSAWTMEGVEYNVWDITSIPDLTNTFWTNEYRKIFYANMVLDYVGKVTGPDADKAALTADAHFIRAYSYWVLANTFCLPYTDANKNEAGLPLKLTISFNESAERQPLSKVYDQIEADLTEALKTEVPLVQNGTARHWRANKAAVNGFVARYWLNRGDYKKANQYATAALAEYSRLVDYNTEMKNGRPNTYIINSGTPQQQSVTLQFPYTHDNQVDYTDMLGWKEFMYFRMLSHGSWWYAPSQDLLSLYDQAHDLRYKYNVVQNYSYDRGLVKPSYSYPGYVFFFKDRIPSGPTVAEMYLTVAEAAAHTGDVTGAMTALNKLREKRMVPGSWVNLTATDKDDAIKKVIDERRREMPFVQRWFDIRRYNNNEYANDDVIMTKSFYPYTASKVSTTEAVQTYTLPKDSRRWAAPIPTTEIISSNGVIKQNTY